MTRSLLLLAIVGCGTSETVTAPRITPPGEPVSVAFKASLWGDEQVWLRLDSGALVRVTTWPLEGAVDQGWSTVGYLEGMGRFGPLALDAARGRLYFGERVGATSRLVTVDLATGDVGFGHSGLQGFPTVALDGDVAVAAGFTADSIFALDVSGAAPVTIASTPAGSLGQYSQLELVRFRGRPLVVAQGFSTAFSRGPDGWHEDEALKDVPGLVAWLDASPDGERLCVVSTEVGGGKVTYHANVLGPSGVAPLALDADASAGRCRWVAKGAALTIVMGTPDGLRLRVFDPAGVAVGAVDGAYLVGEYGGRGIGVRGREVISIDWKTLAVSTVVAESGLPDATCGAGPAYETRVWLPETGPTALGALDCGCLDCMYYGLFTLNLDTGATHLLTPPRELGVLSVAPMADGGFVLATASNEVKAAREDPTWSDRFVRVGADGATTDVGPFPKAPGPLHGVTSGLGE